jgi:hypothetical protein
MAVTLQFLSLQAMASTIWNGPKIGFYHTQENALQDQIVADVKLDRGTGGGLYNTISESSAVAGTSPKGTVWAVGTLAMYTNNPASLSFGPCPLEQGGNPPGDVGTTYVVHLTSASDDIYLELTLTNWGGAGGAGDKTFGYTRTTASVAPPPTPSVSVTNPVASAVFGAPADVTFAASATVSSGSVTNVTFVTNGVAFKSITAAPFTTTARSLAAGAYALKAVATAGGISATSTVVNFTVLNPPSVTITNPLNNAVFAAPATIQLDASASVTGATVTNVLFVTNGVSFKSVTAAPFAVSAINLSAGAYTLKAVATAAGISATSAPVTVSVVNPTPVSVSGAVTGTGAGAGQFSFSYSADVGLTYIVQGSSNLVNWLTLATNTATTNEVPFQSPATNSSLFYRIGRLPNP